MLSFLSSLCAYLIGFLIFYKVGLFIFNIICDLIIELNKL